MARIRPRTVIRAGNSTVTGSNAVNTGSGLILPSTSIITGVGKRNEKATGTPHAQASSTIGSGKRTLKSTGTPHASVATLGGSGHVGDVEDQLQDWIDRSTGNGGDREIWNAFRFDDGTYVDDYKTAAGTSSASPLVFRRPNAGRLGDGMLEMDVPPDVGVSQYIASRFPINPAWTSVSQGIGSGDFYFQLQLEVNEAWLTDSINNGVGGNKIYNIAGFNPSSPNSSPSFTDHEIVVHNFYQENFVMAYSRLPNGNVNPLYIPFTSSYGSDFKLQSALDRGSGVTPQDARYCLYNGPTRAGCFYILPNRIYTIYAHIKILDYGGAGTGNLFELWMADEDDEDYTKLFETHDWGCADDSEYSGGPNGVHLDPYQTGRTGGYQVVRARYDQLIMSPEPIPCPIPRVRQSGPSWIPAQMPNVGRWTQITTVNDPYDAPVDPAKDATANPNYPGQAPWNANGSDDNVGVCEYWGGGLKIVDYGEFGGLGLINAGHFHYLGNELYIWDLGSRIWIRASDPSTTAGGSRPTGLYPNGSPMLPHTYDKLEYRFRSREIFCSNVEINTAGGNEIGKYTFLNIDTAVWRASAAAPDTSSYAGWIAYDEIRDRSFAHPGVYNGGLANLLQYDMGGAAGDPTDGDWHVWDFLNHIALDNVAAFDIDNYIVVVLHEDGTIYAVDPNNPDDNEIELTTSGSGPSSFGRSGWEYSPKRKAFIQHHHGTDDVFQLKLSDETDWRDGTWVWSNLTNGANSVTPPAVNSPGLYSRFRVFDYPDGTEVAFEINDMHGPVYGFRLS